MRMDEIGYNHRHEHDFFVKRPDGTGDWLLLVVKSPVVYRINGVDKRFHAGSFILYKTGFPQYYHAVADEYYDDWIHFEPDECELMLIESLNIPINTPVQLSDTEEASAIIRNMCFEHYSSNKHRSESVDLYFRLLIYKLSEKLNVTSESTRQNPSHYFAKLLWIRDSIYRWPSREYTVDDMAKELSLSRSRFQHLYTEVFGRSVKKDIITSRLQRTVELLTTTQIPVKEISALVGYGSNTSYLVRLFKSVYGVSPGQYRKDNSGNTGQE